MTENFRRIQKKIFYNSSPKLPITSDLPFCCVFLLITYLRLYILQFFIKCGYYIHDSFFYCRHIISYTLFKPFCSNFHWYNYIYGTLLRSSNHIILLYLITIGFAIFIFTEKVNKTKVKKLVYFILYFCCWFNIKVFAHSYQ